MKTRILTAILIILIVAFPVFYGSWPLELLALFIVCAGAWEWMRILPGFSNWSWLLVVAIGGVLGARFVPGSWLFVLVACVVLFLWGLPVFMERFSIVDANSLVVFQWGKLSPTICIYGRLCSRRTDRIPAPTLSAGRLAGTR
ncbi:hypothetical protein [uncultured Dubosiella sp.]|uniref:hypothetical protein n=1 Tax=uncultured Dubosiella sp. TaxID=1937011 RepID=UPI0025B6264E|nr:hypothetical protein [uncultured Dubosiella sp.]